MNQFEIDKLVDDIQGYLNQVEEQSDNVNAVEEPPADDAEAPVDATDDVGEGEEVSAASSEDAV